MKDIWNEIRAAAAATCDRENDQTRIANLCVLSALAFDARLLACGKMWNALSLRKSLDQIALSPLPDLKNSAKSWSDLADLSQIASKKMRAAGGPDQWVQAFQGADIHRKSKGAYATPSTFADLIAEITIAPLQGRPRLRIVDPSAGAGAFLIASLRALRRDAADAELRSIVYGLYGVELDPLSRELCCLLVWLDAAAARPSLKTISQHIIVANAVTYDWWSRHDAFDAVLMNPPWESLRHQSSVSDPSANERLATVERLSEARETSSGLPALFSAQGRGDRNLFKAFVELAPHLVREGGRLGALIPAAFASDLGMSALRAMYFDHFDLEQWSSFENLQRHFPIDTRYKFGVIVGTRCDRGTHTIAIRSFATDPSELRSPHVEVSRPMITKLGGAARMIPELTDANEALVLERMFDNGTPFFEHNALGHQTRYRRELDLTLDKAANKFERFDRLKNVLREPDGSIHSGHKMFVPLIEGRMVGRYDIFQKSWISGHGRTADWQQNGEREFRDCTPQYVVLPHQNQNFRLAICDVTSATNTRTVHAALVPPGWSCGNTAPVLEFETGTAALSSLAVLNSLVFDWMARRIVGGLHLNKFYLAALVWPRLTPEAADRLGHMARAMLFKAPRRPTWINSWVAHGTTDFTSFSRPDLEALIEREVAAAFQLDANMILRVLTPERSDRRGFWRYFAANPSVYVALRELFAEQNIQTDSSFAAA